MQGFKKLFYIFFITFPQLCIATGTPANCMIKNGNGECFRENSKLVLSIENHVMLPELLDQKIHRNKLHAFSNNASSKPVSVFFNRYDETAKYNMHQHNIIMHGEAMQQQMNRLINIKQLKYESSNRKNYIYGFNFSIPLNSNKSEFK